MYYREIFFSQSLTPSSGKVTDLLWSGIPQQVSAMGVYRTRILHPMHTLSLRFRDLSGSRVRVAWVSLCSEKCCPTPTAQSHGRSPRFSAPGAESRFDTGQVLLNRFPLQWPAHHRTLSSAAIFPWGSKPVSSRPWSRRQRGPEAGVQTTSDRNHILPLSGLLRTGIQPGGRDWTSLGGTEFGRHKH